MKTLFLSFCFSLFLLGVPPVLATTLTAYPDPDPETSTVDGVVKNEIAATTWATIHDDLTGSGIDSTNSATYFGYLSAGVSADTWNGINKGVYLFDTSSIGSDVIESSTLTVTTNNPGSENFASAVIYVNVYSSAPATNTALVTGDFDSFGTTPFSDDLQITGVLDETAYDFVLNADGLAAISTSGITKLGGRTVSDATNTPPTHTASASAYITVYNAEAAGTTTDPKLVVVHNAPGPGTKHLQVIIIE